MGRKKKVEQEEQNKVSLDGWKEINHKLNEQVKRNQKQVPTFEQLEKYLTIAVFSLEDNKDDEKALPFALTVSGYAKVWCTNLAIKTGEEQYLDLYWKVVFFETHYRFDSYMLYLEKNRPPKERFYLPRRKSFMKVGLVQALQDLEDDKYDTLTISLAPGTGKTTIEKFFLTWVIGRHLDKYNLFYSHSQDITQLFYEGIMDITQNPEYTYKEIFPDAVLNNKNAKALKMNFGDYKPFPSLQTGTIDSNLAGKVRCNGYLLCDDLIGKMEQALNNNYLDKLWQVKYVGDAKQRKLTGCKEIHIATRWSVRDVIGRLISMKEGDPRFKELSIDCYDENGESQFDFDYGVGLSTAFLHEQEEFYDDISFKCLYRNQPIEREGLLYHADELRTYQSLPQQEPDAILGVCDTKEKGTDFMVLPVMYQYGEDFYMVDTICDNNSDYGIQYQKLTDMILKHNMQQVQFESNQGGSRIAFEVEKRVNEKGGRCNITTKPTETNKETKIIVNADWVKKHVLFKDPSNYTHKSEYGVFMSQLMSYSLVGKTLHDDVPDAMAMFALYVTNGLRVSKVQAVQNPFRRGSYL